MLKKYSSTLLAITVLASAGIMAGCASDMKKPMGDSMGMESSMDSMNKSKMPMKDKMDKMDNMKKMDKGMHDAM